MELQANKKSRSCVLTSSFWGSSDIKFDWTYISGNTWLETLIYQLQTWEGSIWTFLIRLELLHVLNGLTWIFTFKYLNYYQTAHTGQTIFVLMLKANLREVFGSSLRPLSFKNQFTELPPGRRSFSFEKNIKKLDFEVAFILWSFLIKMTSNT